MSLNDLLIQIFNGLVNGAFYTMLSLGLAVIFGMLRVINFAHGALFAVGAFTAYSLSNNLGIGFWPSLVIVPIIVAGFGALLERLFLRRLYHLDPLYNLLLTFGLTLLIQDSLRLGFGISGSPYSTPIPGVTNLGFMLFPTYRLFVIAVVIVVCTATWFVLERTKVGAIVRASTEKPLVAQTLGIDVSKWVTFVFAFGVGLAGLAWVLAAPVRNVAPLMGEELINTTFAVVVIGGLGSILGSVVTGFGLGVIIALGTAIFPPITNTLVFILMALVLVVRPSGLFGRAEIA